MRFDLASMAARAGKLRRTTLLPVIEPTQTLADDLARIYMQVVRRWQAAARGPILAGYEQALEQARAQRALDSLDVRDNIPTLEAVLSVLGDELARLVLELTPALRDWALRVERWHRGRWIGGVLTATGVDLSTMVGPEDEQLTIEAVVARNVALVRSVSDQARDRIADIVFRGFQARSPAREVAKEMAEAVQLGRKRALRIASDQMSKLSAELDAERQRQAGIVKWKWRHSRKRHPRELHVERDGKIYTDKTAPKDLPGMLPFCGCRRQAVVEFD